MDRLPGPGDVSSAACEDRDASDELRFRRSRGMSPKFGARSATKFQLFTPHQLKSLPDPEWLIEGIIPQDALAALYAQPAAGKSLLCLDWANHVALGRAWNGLKVCQGDVVYVNAEGISGLKLRNEAWEKEHDVLAERVRFILGPVNMQSRDEVMELIGSIRKSGIQPILIILDTLARCFGGGDENAAKDMGQFVNHVDELRRAFSGCTVLIVHHTLKENPNTERGHSSLRGAVNTTLRLSNNTSGRTLHSEKQKDGDAFQAIPLALATVDLGQGRRSCVIRPRSQWGGQDHAVAAPKSAEEHALEVLTNAGSKGMTYSDWKSASGLKKTKFKQVRAKILGQEKVVHVGGVYRIAGARPHDPGNAGPDSAA